MKKSLTVITIIILSIASCSKKGGTDNTGGTIGGGGSTTTACTSVPKAFAADVNPIIQGFCNVVGCHNSGSPNGPGALTNYTQIFNARSNIRAAVSSGLMPQGTSLSTAQKNSIICWIDAGAQNN